MNKNILVVGTVVVAVVMLLGFGSSHQKAVDQVELAYVNAYSSVKGYAVKCQHKEVDERQWLRCESSPVKNIGLWEIVGTDGQYQYLASNGKALAVMSRFNQPEFKRNSSSINVLSAFDG